MIYLATPYWHEDAEVRSARVMQAIFITRALIRAGQAVFSPIAHSDALNNPDKTGFFHPLPLTNGQWVDLDLFYIKSCKFMLVAQIEGWRTSEGIKREVEFCRFNCIPTFYLLPQDCATMDREERERSWVELSKSPA